MLLSNKGNQQETGGGSMLSEFQDLVDPKLLPARRKELHYYLAGFADGEACFSVSIKRQKGTRFGWVLDPVFQVTQSKEHAFVLRLFKRILGCGRVIPKPGQPEMSLYLVDNRRQLTEKVIPFFERYKLLVKKSDFELFKKIVLGLEARKHWTKDGFIELVELAFQMNQKGKQRRYTKEEILTSLEDTSRILRGHTPDAPNMPK